MDTLAVTDHGAMYGAIEFLKEAKNQGLKPIIGMEAYTTNLDHKVRPERGKFKNFHLLLLAKNMEGYKNLMQLTSIAHLEGYYYRPRVDRDTLKKYSKGLICTSACPLGEVGQALIEGDHKKTHEIISWFLDVFGEDYYLEVQRHQAEKFIKNAPNPEIARQLQEQVENEKKINEGIVKLSREFGIPIVATNDAHYVRKEDAVAQDALVCVATGKNIEDVQRLRFIDSPTFYVKSPREMRSLFNDLPESIENTLKVAEKCEIEITLGQWFFPKIDIPKGKTPEEILKTKTYKKIKETFPKLTRELKEKIDYELDIIIKKGYAPYFLIFEDMANWAKQGNIPINTRGSAAGSLVSFVLGITTVDPIKYNLPFERFLNPFRPSLPDIDMDIADDKREEMIAHLIGKYGSDKVAQICTFGRMLARASVRDVARVLGYPYATGDRIAKLIPLGSQGFPMTIERALNESKDLKALYEVDSDAKKVINLAKQIEGNARHISVHAAGIVISPTKLTDFTPVQLEPSGDKIITQYEMRACEDIGLVKLDVLGIRNLSILRGAVELVEQISGEKIDLSKIPIDDKKTFEMLARGETMGTFQLSGSGMTRYLVELKPEKVEDIMAMIALFRPGPMANIPEYIARKKGEKQVTYYHPKMEKFLDKSYGILVYQDDLLFTALEVAGYNWESVDKFRKAVGKKIPEEMAKQHEIFVEGCMKHSAMTKEEAEGLWRLFEPFQGYGFNKAHAASYGIVAYQTAYMKANYPVEFMCSLLTADSGDTDKISTAVNECRKMGIKVFPPDINESDVNFKIMDYKDSLHGRAIRFGLEAIKNVGKAAVEAILGARQERSFANFADFMARVDSRKVNKKVLESLIKVGAMSEFGSRAALLSSIDEIRLKIGKTTANTNQQALFGGDEVSESSFGKTGSILRADINEFSEEELQNLERQLLGFSLSAKPIGELLGEFEKMATHKIYEISPQESFDDQVKIAAVVSEVRIIITRKSGQEMAFVKVQDETGSLELVVFPSIYQNTRSIWIDNKPLLISGKIDFRDESPSIIVESVAADTRRIDKGEEGRLFIKIPKFTTPDKLKNLKDLLISYPGHQSVTLIFETNGEKIDLSYKISWSERLARMISEVLE